MARALIYIPSACSLCCLAEGALPSFAGVSGGHNPIYLLSGKRALHIAGNGGTGGRISKILLSPTPCRA